MLYKNSNRPWSRNELVILALYTPTEDNLPRVVRIVERSPKAVIRMWERIFSPNKVIEHKLALSTSEEDIWHKIDEARRLAEISLK